MRISKRIHNMTRLGIAPAILVLLAPFLAIGSVVVQMDLEDLVESSDAIIEGVVEAVYSQWDGDRRMVFTYASLRVDDPLKGERRRAILIRQMGGSVGALHVNVPGTPRFDEGSRVIVFLKDAANGTFHVVGMNQGRYVIAEDFAVSNVTGVDLLNRETGLVSGASFVRKYGLAEFKARIRELAR